MAQFSLNWINVTVLINPNAISQRVGYRQKSVGGVFITTGFTPSNDLPKTASVAISPVLAENIVWEFQVMAICTEGGPTLNDNGIQEQLKFACVPIVLNQTTTTAQITLNVSNTDLTKARFTLRLVADDSIVSGPTIVNRAGNSITGNAVGLTDGTAYYWEIELYATVGGVERISSSSIPSGGLGVSCFSADFSTDLAICLPCTDIDATVIEV